MTKKDKKRYKNGEGGGDIHEEVREERENIDLGRKKEPTDGKKERNRFA